MLLLRCLRCFLFYTSNPPRSGPCTCTCTVCNSSGSRSEMLSLVRLVRGYDRRLNVCAMEIERYGTGTAVLLYYFNMYSRGFPVPLACSYRVLSKNQAYLFRIILKKKLPTRVHTHTHMFCVSTPDYDFHSSGRLQCLACMPFIPLPRLALFLKRVL